MIAVHPQVKSGLNVGRGGRSAGPTGPNGGPGVLRDDLSAGQRDDRKGGLKDAQRDDLNAALKDGRKDAPRGDLNAAPRGVLRDGPKGVQKDARSAGLKGVQNARSGGTKGANTASATGIAATVTGTITMASITPIRGGSILHLWCITEPVMPGRITTCTWNGARTATGRTTNAAMRISATMATGIPALALIAD